MGHRGTIAAAQRLGALASCALALLCISPYSLAAQASNQRPSQIEKLCSREKHYAEQHKDGALLFSAVPQNQDPARDRWQRATSAAQFQNAAKNGDSTARVWVRDGKVAWIDALFQNQFGDSVQAVQYCYGPDGTLALLHSELKSFHGGIRVVREMTFDAAGKQLSKTTESYDLASGKREAIPRDFWDFPPPVFLRAGELPFAKELH